MKGWHGRGRVIRHSGVDYGALLPAAIGQGISLYKVARQAKQELKLGLPDHLFAPTCGRQRA
jgi:hypothetical protein